MSDEEKTEETAENAAVEAASAGGLMEDVNIV